MLWAGLNDRDKAASLHKAPGETRAAETQSLRVAHQFYEFLMAMPKVSRRFFLQVIGKAAALMGAGAPKLIDPVPQIPSGVDPRMWNFYFSEVVKKLYCHSHDDYSKVYAIAMEGDLSEGQRYAQLLEFIRIAKPNERALRLAAKLKHGDFSLLEGDWDALNSLRASLNGGVGPKLSPHQVELLSRQTGLAQLGLEPSSVVTYFEARAEFAGNLPRHLQSGKDQPLVDPVNDHRSNDFAALWMGAESSPEYYRDSIEPHLPGYADEQPYIAEPPERRD